MTWDILVTLLKANPEKTLDLLSQMIDLMRSHPPLLDGLTKWIEAQAAK